MFVKELQQVNFSNYEHFSCIDAAYTDFLTKLMKVVNEIAWVDPCSRKIALKFKKSKFHIDEENYKKIKYQGQNLLRKKKREFYETKS